MQFSSLQILSRLQQLFEQRITFAVKSLLETKHLYQSITLRYEDLFNTIGEITDQQTLEEIKNYFL
jgi:hypothetical protein